MQTLIFQGFKSVWFRRTKSNTKPVTYMAVTDPGYRRHVTYICDALTPWEVILTTDPKMGSELGLACKYNYFLFLSIFVTHLYTNFTGCLTDWIDCHTVQYVVTANELFVPVSLIWQILPLVIEEYWPSAISSGVFKGKIKQFVCNLQCTYCVFTLWGSSNEIPVCSVFMRGRHLGPYAQNNLDQV